MFPLSKFRNGQPLAAISSDWLNTVSAMLNGLTVQSDEELEAPEVQTPSQNGENWKLRIPGGGSSIKGTPRLYAVAAFREYDVNDNIVAVGLETGSGTLKLTADWVRFTDPT